jgi:hypothetical protein
MLMIIDLKHTVCKVTILDYTNQVPKPATHPLRRAKPGFSPQTPKTLVTLISRPLFLFCPLVHLADDKHINNKPITNRTKYIKHTPIYPISIL